MKFDLGFIGRYMSGMDVTPEGPIVHRSNAANSKALRKRLAANKADRKARRKQRRRG